jgi:F420-non-reducing hydrogenase iron-sulfur subunit
VSVEPDEDFEPEIVLLYCRQTVNGGDGVETAAAGVTGFSVRPVMMPCSSKVQVSHLLRIIEEGADGLEMVACPEESCSLLVGSVRARKRIEQARSLLGEIGMGEDRLGITHGSGLSVGDLMGAAGRRADAVRRLGANPMKEIATDPKNSFAHSRRHRCGYGASEGEVRSTNDGSALRTCRPNLKPAQEPSGSSGGGGA